MIHRRGIEVMVASMHSSEDLRCNIEEGPEYDSWSGSIGEIRINIKVLSPPHVLRKLKS